MQKALEVATRAKAAWQALTELGGQPISIDLNRYSAEVHVGTLRDLGQVPGEYNIEPFPDISGEFPWRAAKVCDGVMFFTLLKQKEYEGLQCTSTTIRD